MIARSLTIATVLVAAGLFGWAIPLTRVFDAFQPMITALSIMVAAIFVRLNRGMPTLEWKSVDPDGRHKLTSSIVESTREYGWIIALYAIALLGLVTMTIVGKADVADFWPAWAQRLVSGIVGDFGALCIARMTYVVWRDIDVVRLQKRLIDGSASRDSLEVESKRADEKVTSIRSAGLRKVEVLPPKAWGE